MVKNIFVSAYFHCLIIMDRWMEIRAICPYCPHSCSGGGEK